MAALGRLGLGLGQCPLRPGDGNGSDLREPLHLQNRQEVVSGLKPRLKKHISDRLGGAGRMLLPGGAITLKDILCQFQSSCD